MGSEFGIQRTIAAVATPYGEGGIGVIKISGDAALNVLYAVFNPCGNYGKGVKHGIERIFSFEEFASHMEKRRMRYGHVFDPESHELIDEVMAVYMKGPHTYSGEDVAEIYCHGSIIALRKTLSAVIASGASPAEPGEFTKRAFLSGRLDLAQAEAVMDLIHAESGRSHEAALEQLNGSLSGRIDEIRRELEEILIFIAATLDYPDEDLEEQSYIQVEKQLSELGDKLSSAIATADIGKIIRCGLRVAIIGKPNVGKSSLMNAFLQESRAIVTSIPGTTRDTIEEAITIDGIKIILTDTAGMRETSDEVEMIGIERSKNAFRDADIVIFVLDAAEGISGEDEKIFSQLGTKPTIIILNKNDLPRKIEIGDIKKIRSDLPIINASLERNEGLEELRCELLNYIYKGKARPENATVITNERQLNLLKKAKSSLDDSIDILRIKEPLDIVEIDVRRAYDFLGEILGRRTSEDIINGIFDHFCLGK